MKTAKKTEVRHLLKAMTLGMKAEEASRFVVEKYEFHGGDWNTNNKAKLDQEFVEGLLTALLKSKDPGVLFYTAPEWTYAGEREDGEPSDVTAIRYRKGKDSSFSLPYHPADPEALDLPWYDDEGDAENDAELLNRLVSDLFGMEDQHERRMELLGKSRRKDVLKMASKAEGSIL